MLDDSTLQDVAGPAGRSAAPVAQALHAAVALSALAAATALAVHHPAWPLAATLALAAWLCAAMRYPTAWLLVVPAVLPMANLSPWTGWIVFDEFDIVVLAAVAAGHARLALARSPRFMPGRGAATLTLSAAALGIYALARGFEGAGPGPSFDGFAGYAEPLNGVRVLKPLLLALAIWPMVQQAVQSSPERALRRFAAGLAIGLAIVVGAAAWERAVYPGFADFGARYRTTALFWEMHVGGAALDAYLAMTVPLLAWWLLRARSWPAWTAAAALALLTEYVCLTTFSRGVYLAVPASLIVLGAWLRRRPPPSGAALPRPVSRRAWLLGAVLLLEAFLVLGPGSFMHARIAESRLDTRSRIEHWRQGLALVDGTSWLWGIGLGRLPRSYERAAPEVEFPGRTEWGVGADGGNALVLWGPATRPALGGLYAITQRVAPRSRYKVAFTARADRPTALLLSVCQRHLLYDSQCQRAFVQLWPGPQWQRLAFALHGPDFEPRPWFAQRETVWSATVVNAGGAAWLDDIELSGPDGAPLLSNGDFSRGMARWLPSARRYFVPWHIDNLYLEVLIERGLAGLLVAAAIVAATLRRLWRAPAPAAVAAPFLGACMAGALCIGLVSSVLDMPRVAFLLGLLLAFSYEFAAPARPANRGRGRQ
jgi:O-antigen ligase